MNYTLICSFRMCSITVKSIPKLFNSNLNIKVNRVALGYVTQTQRSFADRRYSDKHEWISLDSNPKIGTVGVSHYAQEALGDVVYVQLPDVGSTYDQNDEVGAVESVKAASEIYTPVSGKIIEINKALEDKPGLVNSSCYEQGWLFKVEISKSEEISKLMDENAYQNYLKSIKDE